MTCGCGHPAHHHLTDRCATITVKGPASEVHEDRWLIPCVCDGYEAADV